MKNQRKTGKKILILLNPLIRMVFKLTYRETNSKNAFQLFGMSLL